MIIYLINPIPLTIIKLAIIRIYKLEIEAFK